jgi:hypothetical protein
MGTCRALKVFRAEIWFGLGCFIRNMPYKNRAENHSMGKEDGK